MSENSKYVTPQFKKVFNPKIGLITLSTDLTMESDFYSIGRDLPIDIFVNRIKNYNPLTKENLLKMYDQLESVTKDILPDEKINTVAYGCTSGTIAAGYNSIETKIKQAKSEAKVTTPSTAAIKALKKLKIAFDWTDEMWIGEYQLQGTKIWDSARLLHPKMYRKGQLQCLSFGNGKPLSVKNFLLNILLRYLSDVSHNTVTIVLLGPKFSASFIAPAILMPELVPKFNPSFSNNSNNTDKASVSLML